MLCHSSQGFANHRKTLRAVPSQQNRIVITIRWRTRAQNRERNPTRIGDVMRRARRNQHAIAHPHIKAAFPQAHPPGAFRDVINLLTRAVQMQQRGRANGHARFGKALRFHGVGSGVEKLANFRAVLGDESSDLGVVRMVWLHGSIRCGWVPCHNFDSLRRHFPSRTKETIMAVNYKLPTPARLHPVPGVALGFAEAHIRKPNRKDMLIVSLAPGSRAAGVFTQNRFCAAPVTVCRSHLHDAEDIRALVINTGCANAGTGDRGLLDAKTTAKAVADALGCKKTQVLPFSTGVILEHLPMDRILAGIPKCVANLTPTGWFDAAHAIMTTDTVPKAISKQIRIYDQLITITGISKGAGMIQPNMATMLGFIATDARVGEAVLRDMVKEAADVSFNSITIDGDTSTNDSFVLIATGQAKHPEINGEGTAEYGQLQLAINEVAIELAQAIVRDGEGATKFITVKVDGGKSHAECMQVAKAIGHSPLVKTAFFASDPNLGRILAAIGNAGIADLEADKIKLYLGKTLVAEKGGRAESYREEDGVRVMKEAEILVHVELNRGKDMVTLWTCDFSYDYVKINADYRS